MADLVVAMICHISPKGFPLPCTSVDLAPNFYPSYANSCIYTHLGPVLDPLGTSLPRFDYANSLISTHLGPVLDP